MALTIIGLDGLEREAVFAIEGCKASHGLHTAAGYIVRRTFWPGQKRAHEDVERFDDRRSYGEALASVRKVRMEQARACTRHTPADDGTKGYGVIDTLYTCGCRGMG